MRRLVVTIRANFSKTVNFGKENQAKSFQNRNSNAQVDSTISQNSAEIVGNPEISHYSSANRKTIIEKLLSQNKMNRSALSASSESYWASLSEAQTPKIMWIGCSDSRVDPVNILDMPPGSLYIQRNVANLVNSDDPNVLSVLEFAIVNLEVEFIVVCGHTNCGGIKATCQNFHGLNSVMQSYLKPVEEHFQEIKKEQTVPEYELVDHMYSANVARQVENLMANPYVKEALEAGKLEIVPLLFNIGTGLLETVEL